MRKTLSALAFLALAPTAAAALTPVQAPFPGGTVRLHPFGTPNAVDIVSTSCNYWGVNTAVVGSLSWSVTIRTTGIVCNGNGSGSQNEVKHVFATGYTFRQWHFIKTADSYDRTCDRCQVGNVGGTGNATSPHSHLQYDKLGTLDTEWISPDLVDGQSAPSTIGYL
jgi:hypothetical protein